MTEVEIIKGCTRHDKVAQKALYEQFYNKMMGICLRYSKDEAEAKKILNEGFLTIFGTIKNYRGNSSLEEWIRNIIINTAIDALKKNKQTYWIVNTVNAAASAVREENLLTDQEIVNSVNQKDILKAVQNLSPAYRVIFNLFSIDKYTHQQISERLDISEATSIADLTKAKYNIRKNLIRICNEK